ncbi:Hsp70 family protein [Dactylosporangium sp. AC04546]|uniref:Hsp70 family protein n=1 Tax=Dactylosporangium sp. AC04546 TaxID=2862460 RepID=UPI001EDF6D04|nr:Hsp70 family protein [Dactylosporangium sp. AC04546]WVK78738.1 Hsp70 family protein [Dactylosporangium sp. AC04546]
MTERIGIDFGTANTVVARWDDGRAEPVALPGYDVVREPVPGLLQRVVPSVIGYREVGARLSAVLGAGALTLPPDAGTVFRSMKSHLSGRVADVPRRVGEHRISGRDAATEFLRGVTALAVLAIGADDLEIVATAPVETFDSYRDWLVTEVGADLPQARLRVVDEATAAAVGYGARMSPGDTFCVFDFGAGTLDVSVVRVRDADEAGSGAGVRVIAKAGADLGGNHVDALLARHVLERAGGPPRDPIRHNQVFAALLREAEAAKVALSHTETATVAVPGARPVRIARDEFERLLQQQDVLGRVNRTLRRVLDAAAGRGYPAGDLARVFLVGGTSLVPAVQDLLRLQFEPGVLHLDRPLEAVAVGAAGIAGGRELHDHIQHDYAIRHVDQASGAYRFEPLVAAGTPYPTEEPVKSLTIRGVRSGQRRLGLAVYELAHATARDGGAGGADIEIVFDRDGGARAVGVTDQQRQERSTLWLNEDSPTFLEADPPAQAGADRFLLEFRIDSQKRLTVSAFDLDRKTWLLQRRPVVRLA